MKKETLIKIAVGLFIFITWIALMYVLTAFITFEFDPWFWTKHQRITMSLVSLTAGIMIALAVAFNIKPNKS